MELSKLNLRPSGIRQVFDLARKLEESRTVYHLEIGQPYFDPPPFIYEAAHEAVAEGAFKYVENRGDMNSRRALCAWLNAQFPQQLNPEEDLVFTVGGSEALVAVYRALLNDGDQVLVPTPAWVHYQEATRLFNAAAIEIPLSEENGFKLTIPLLEKYWTPKVKVLVFNNPNNPTGVCYDLDFQRELLQWAKNKNVILLIDEIYDCYNYNNEFVSILNLPDIWSHVVYLNGFSKSLGITGLRVGYVLGSKLLCDKVNIVHQYLTVCTSSFSLRVVDKALRSPQLTPFLHHNREEHKKRFLLTRDRLSSTGVLQLSKTAGAFYFFISYPRHFGDSHAVTTKLLYERGIALSPGVVFGEGYTHHFRLCFSTEWPHLELALKEIKNFFEGR